MAVIITKIVFLSYQAVVSFFKTSRHLGLNYGDHPQQSYKLPVSLKIRL